MPPSDLSRRSTTTAGPATQLQGRPATSSTASHVRQTELGIAGSNPLPGGLARDPKPRAAVPATVVPSDGTESTSSEGSDESLAIIDEDIPLAVQLGPQPTSVSRAHTGSLKRVVVPPHPLLIERAASYSFGQAVNREDAGSAGLHQQRTSSPTSISSFCVSPAPVTAIRLPTKTRTATAPAPTMSDANAPPVAKPLEARPFRGRLTSPRGTHLPARPSPLTPSHSHSHPSASPVFGSPSSFSGPRPSTLPEGLRASAKSVLLPQMEGSEKTLSSPCFVHSHLDSTLNDFVKRRAGQSRERRRSATRRAEAAAASAPAKLGADPMALPATPRSRRSSASSLVSGKGDESSDEGGLTEGEEPESLTRQLAETATSVREMSKQLGRARVKSSVQSILIITKARDNHLIRLTRELALWLMDRKKEGDKTLVVYVDRQLQKSKRFDVAGMQREHPEFFRPLESRHPHHRRYSRNNSMTSLASSPTNGYASGQESRQKLRKMTPLSAASSGSGSEGGANAGQSSGEEKEGQLRYWTAEMCTQRPELFDFVITLGGDGTVLFASWLFQRVVPPLIPFALGSLGFLTNFDFNHYPQVLESAIDDGVRVNLRMRFTCTVYRAETPLDADVGGLEGKQSRRAIRSGKTGEIFMKSIDQSGWESVESGGPRVERLQRGGAGPGREGHGKCSKDKEIMCFTTRPAESFEVINELVVDRGPSPYVSLLELFGDEHHMTTVQADGLTVSTPTGSTAYSLSAGGSLVHPEIPAILITPICPHTLSFRPMLLPDSMELRICVPYNSRSTAWASFDGRGRVELRQGDHIKVTASRFPMPTVCADKQSTDWFHAISRTLKWNERQRQKSFVVVEEGARKKRSPGADRKKAQAANEERIAPPSPAKLADKEDDDDDDNDDDEEEEDDDEGFDIDDLSSATAGSPAEEGKVASRTKPTQTPGPHGLVGPETHSVDSPERFRDPCPHPPRLSSRHTTLHAYDEAQAEKATRGADGGRDNAAEPPETKRRPGTSDGVAYGSAAAAEDPAKTPVAPTSGIALGKRASPLAGKDSKCVRIAAKHAEEEMRAFAVWGEDQSDASLSDADY